jgi:hypothetical protein
VDRELANLRAAFQWAAQQGDLDTAATITVFVAALSLISGSTAEAVTWAEQLLPAATQARHRLLLALNQAAAWCALYGRPAEGVAYADQARVLYGDPTFEQNIYGTGALLASGAYAHGPSLDRWVPACREVLAVADDPLLACRSLLAMALALTGQADEALALCEGLVPGAVATGNPYAHAVALEALGVVQAESDPTSAVAAMRQCLEVCRQSGMRRLEILVYPGLARLEIAAGDYRPALDLLRNATRWHFDAGDSSSLTWCLTLSSAVLARCGLTEPAAIIAGFATTPFTMAVYPEFASAVQGLRQTLGDDDFQRLSERGQSTPRSEVVAYGLQAIEEARTRLERHGP